MDSWDKEKIVRTEIIEDIFSIALVDRNSKRQVKISSRLNPEDVDELTKTLQQNTDIFAWSAIDMLEISPKFITHQLNISPSYHLVRQKRRQLAPERSWAMSDEVTQLIEADLIHEVHYPGGLVNVVLIKKTQWEVEDVHQQHRPEQSLSQG